MNATVTARLFALVLVASVGALGAPPADAQRGPGQRGLVQPGERVRVTTAGANRFAGRLLPSGPDTLVVATEAGPVAVPARTVDHVEVSRGHRSNAGVGAGLGLLGGGLLGGLLGAATYTEPPPCEGRMFCGMFDFGPGAHVAGGAILGGLVGLVVGTVVGATTRTERWERAAGPLSVGLGRVRPADARPLPALAVRVDLR